MKKYQWMITLLLLIFLARPSWAINWKSLHDRYKKIPVAELQERKDKDPDDLKASYMLALHFLDQHTNEKARDLFQSILSRDSDHLGARWGMAEVQRRDHEYAKSQSRLQSLIDSHPEFVPAYLTLAYIHYVELSFKKSIDLTSKVIDMGRENVDLDNLTRAHGLYAANKGMLAKRANPFTKPVHFFAMKRHLNTVQELQPDSFAALLGQASYLMAIPPFLGRDLQKAEALFLKAVKKDPYNPEPHVRLAQIYQYQGQTKKADQYLQKAEELDPQDKMLNDFLKGTCEFVCLEEK